ncbi:hypothetical protein D3C76_1463440 [compost metagenome]
MTDFDAAMGGHHRHQAQQTLGLARGQVDHCEEQRVGAGAVAVEPVIEALTVLEWAVGQVVPELGIGIRALQHLPQIFVVAPGVEFFQADVTPGHRCGGREFRWLPL